MEDEDCKDAWMVRPCMLYKEEYKECTCLKGRFHQYFIHGKTIDCSQWERDYENCNRWSKGGDKKALAEIVKSETDRRLKRLANHYKNNVWEKRTEPPEDWNKPLPDWMEKEFQTSYLQLRSQEMKLDGAEKPPTAERTLCVLL
ncbi:synaptic plasticity regulator PANTS [Bacillus rossius redtenbacheri]|uniref:synaptic plasticity regulator PANTS n=1 Tax=Bacillus rossius redtenbacheri TaxID=93214 RepID=UPI002FDD38F0